MLGDDVPAGILREIRGTAVRHLARLGLEQPGDLRERRLAGAVRARERDDLAARTSSDAPSSTIRSP